MISQKIQGIVFRKVDDVIEFLLLKRIESKGGFWQPVTGSVEKEDSSILDGAFRELAEEIGISRSDVILVVEDVYSFTFSDAHGRNCEEFAFGFEVASDFSVTFDRNVYKEHEAFEWFSFDVALEKLIWDSNKIALKKLFTLLQK